MIDYIEIRAAATREIIGIIDTAKSIIWHVLYYDTGDFEIYAPCNNFTVNLLVAGNYVSRPNEKHVGIIENVEYIYNIFDGRMIVATGRMCKSILDRRIIYRLSGYSVSPTILSGNVETAARTVVNDNAIACSFDSARNMSVLVLGTHSGSTKTIVDSGGNPTTKQVTYNNLMLWTNEFLREYEIGSYIGIDDNLKLSYCCFEGVDRSIDNIGGNDPVIFSQQFDNLLSSDYVYGEEKYKNMALVGGEGEGTTRFCSVLIPSLTGFERREKFIDASSSSKKYKDEHGDEQTLTDAEYNSQLQAIAAQDLAGTQITQKFDGEINLNNGVYKYKTNFDLGDIVTIQDNEIGLYTNTRILEIIETQDDNGYNISAKYGV